jgi:UDP-N-acetylmuramoylalanine--D-glutamate ligase
MMNDWNGRRVLILGAARQGLALARWLSLHGAQVTLSDSRGADDLRAACESLAEFPIEWAVGGHPLELLDSTDVLCLSGGVPLTLPIVAEAMKRNIRPLGLPGRLARQRQPRWLDRWQGIRTATNRTWAATSVIH